MCRVVTHGLGAGVGADERSPRIPGVAGLGEPKEVGRRGVGPELETEPPVVVGIASPQHAAARVAELQMMPHAGVDLGHPGEEVVLAALEPDREVDERTTAARRAPCEARVAVPGMPMVDEAQHQRDGLGCCRASAREKRGRQCHDGQELAHRALSRPGGRFPFIWGHTTERLLNSPDQPTPPWRS